MRKLSLALDREIVSSNSDSNPSIDGATTGPCLLFSVIVTISLATIPKETDGGGGGGGGGGDGGGGGEGSVQSGCSACCPSAFTC